MSNRRRDIVIGLMMAALAALNIYQSYIIHQKTIVSDQQSALIADYQESLADAVIAVNDDLLKIIDNLSEERE